MNPTYTSIDVIVLYPNSKPLLGDSAYVWEQRAGVRFLGEEVNPEMSIFKVGKNDSDIFIMFSLSERLSNIPSDR